MSTARSDGVFPLPGEVGSIYGISADQWGAINEQVAVVVRLQPLSWEITGLVPNYPTLLPVCSKWQSQTYQSLLAQAVLVGTFAVGVPGVLAKLRDAVASSADADALTPGQHFQMRVQFEAFANHAGTIESSVEALAPDIAAFVAENQKADATLEQIAKSLPPEWQSIAGPLGDLSKGFAAVQSGWSGIASQLQALASGQARFTTAGQFRAAVAAATPAWTALNLSAIAFYQHATNPTG